MTSESENEEDNERVEQLKNALWYAIGRLVDDRTLQLSANATPQFIAALTEAVWAQIDTAATDVEAFAKHAGRTQITVDDVMLLARRNEQVEQMVRSRIETVRQAQGWDSKSKAKAKK